MPERTYVEALNEALHEEMERDEKVFLMGEDVVFDYFGVCAGLADRFGRDRVRDTPICELGFTGAGVGAAMAGFRPIVDLRFMDFATYALDPIVNQAAKLRYMLGGQLSVPMVARIPSGAGLQYGATHGQSLEAWFMQVPGLKVLYPSCPPDAKGLLKAAVRDDNPVMFIEHRLLYAQKTKQMVPEGDYTIPIGVADVKREGGDVTVVGIGYQMRHCLEAAEALAGEGIDCEVIDPRSLSPLDVDTITNSVRKTSRCVIVEEGHLRSGVAAEISATIQESVFEYLDAPIGRVAALMAPIPVQTKLEKFVLPSTEKVIAAVRKTLGVSV